MDNGHISFSDKPCQNTSDTEPKSAHYREDTLPSSASIPTPISNKSVRKVSDSYSSDRWYVDVNGYQNAARLSEKYNAPMLLYFQADWCHYCRELENNLLSLGEAKLAMRPFIKVRITPEHGDSEKALFDNLGGTGYPTLMLKSNVRALPEKLHTMNKINGEWELLSPYEFKKRLDQKIEM